METALELREVRVYGAGKHELEPIPWLAAIRVIACGGHGGQATDGSPGGAGEVVDSGLLVAPAGRVRFAAGRGGKGCRGGADGEDGSVFVELWALSPYHQADRKLAVNWAASS